MILLRLKNPRFPRLKIIRGEMGRGRCSTMNTTTPFQARATLGSRRKRTMSEKCQEFSGMLPLITSVGPMSTKLRVDLYISFLFAP